MCSRALACGADLTKHPDVFAYKLRGEPQDGENHYELAAPEHAREYAAVRDGQLVGDANVSRLVNDAVAIARCYGATPPRMIALLREPVGRCVSQMQMRMRLRTQIGTTRYDMNTNLTKVVQLDAEHFEAYLRKHLQLATMQRPPPPNNFMRSPPNCLYEGGKLRVKVEPASHCTVRGWLSARRVALHASSPRSVRGALAAAARKRARLRVAPLLVRRPL